MEPDGTKLTEVDSPNGAYGPELVSWIAHAAGLYRLEVRSLEKGAAPGKYEARIDTLRRSIPQDLYRIRASNAYVEGDRQVAKGTAESLRQALSNFSTALADWQAVNDQQEAATTLNNMAFIQDFLGEKQRALEYYQQALSIWRQAGNRGGEATALNNIGAVYESLTQNQRALEYYKQALPIFQQVGDRGREAKALNNIGLIYYFLGRSRESIEHFEQALLVMREVAERGAEATTLSNLGLVYRSLGEKEKALDYFTQALPMMHNVGDRDGEAVALAGIGSVYDDLGEKQKALKYFNEALPILRQAGDRSGEVRNLNNIGVVYNSLGDKQRAMDYYSQQGSCNSYELTNAAGIEDVAKDFYRSLRLPAPVDKSGREKTRAEPVYTVASARRIESLSRRVSEMLLAPVASMLGNKRLVVIPDRALQYLPFAALADPVEKKAWQPLILGHEIVSLPSASVLAIQRRELDGREPAPKTAIVIADPVFSADDIRVKRAEDERVSENGRAAGAPAPPAGSSKAPPGSAVPDEPAGTDASGTEVGVEAKSFTADAGGGRVAPDDDEPLYQSALKRAVRSLESRATRGDLPRLPGTRLEGEDIVALARPGQSKLIVDFAASRAAVESNELSHISTFSSRPMPC
jgi:tetratricopeptide (TPR) repeat protein